MTINFGRVPIGAVLPIHFASYNGAGASVTLTGLAVTDIEIYKGTTVTQRSSDAGYVLIDTDGIDIDGITGAHGFSIDTGDNTDASFYAAGSYYNVWVSSVTIDGQTVNILAATFYLVPAEFSAGIADVNAVLVSDATPETAATIAAATAVAVPDITEIEGAITTQVGTLVIEGGTTLTEAQRITLAAVAGKSSKTGATRKYRDLADTKDRISAVVTSTGDRTSVTIDDT